jgi:hypothetical protein
MTEQFRRDLQAELAVVRTRPGEIEARRSSSKLASRTAHSHGFSKPFVFGLVPLFGCLVFMGGTVSADDALFIDPQGLVGIGTPDPGEKLQVSKGKIQLDGDQQIKFTNADTSNNLKLQLWSGYGLGINGRTLFYAADGNHSWRDNYGANERMVLTTAPDGGLTVTGTGKSSFAGDVGIAKDLAVEGKGNSSFAGNVGITKDLTVNGTGHSSFSGNVSIGTGTLPPVDKLDVAGNLRVLTDSNPIRFTAKWSNFPHTEKNGAEISNDTDVYKALMLVGNRSGNGNIRRVNIWDQLIVSGDLFVTGRLVYKSNESGRGGWKQVYQERNDWAGSRATTGPDPEPSDLRLKSQVQTLPTSLEKIIHLRGVSYRWNDEALKYFTRDIEKNLSAGPDATEADNQKLWKTEREKRYKELATNQVGVVAQDVESVLPEAVTTNEAGYKAVRYHYLIPLLIEALKEQNKTVKDQAQLLARQQQEIARLAATNLAVEQKLAELAAVREQIARLEATVQRVAATQAFGTIEAVAQLSETKTR